PLCARAEGRGAHAGRAVHRRRPGAARSRDRRDAGARRLRRAARRRRERPGPQARPRKLVFARSHGPAALAAELSGITLDSATARRGASLRNYGPSRAAAESAYALAARGDTGARAEEAPRAAEAVRRLAGAHARRHRRLEASEGDISAAGRGDLRAVPCRLTDYDDEAQSPERTDVVSCRRDPAGRPRFLRAAPLRLARHLGPPRCGVAVRACRQHRLLRRVSRSAPRAHL